MPLRLDRFVVTSAERGARRRDPRFGPTYNRNRWTQWLALLVGAVAAASARGGLDAADQVDFAHDIAPILRRHCAKCHTGDKPQGGLSLETREALLAGGESGKVVLPGRAEASRLVHRLTTADEQERMPPEGARLTATQIAKLKIWIDAGAEWDAGLTLGRAAYEPPLRPRRVAVPAGPGQPLDRLVAAYRTAHELPTPELAPDSVWLRRLSLDLIGLLPTAEETIAFQQDRSPTKYVDLVDRLLSDDIAYAEHWLTFWNDLLRNDYSGTGFITGGRKQITTWLYRSLVENKPYDQFVRELIQPTAESEGFIQGIRWRGDVSASQSNEIQFSQSISQALLGINMKCASCHDSFVDRWQLNDAYGLAAIYATQPLPMHRCDKPTGATAVPRWIFPELGQIDAAAPQPERLRQLAALLTHPENGRLSRTIVNRLWQRLLGRGIVHPVDAMDTEPWSADVLDYLALDLQEHQSDLKHALRVICSSRTYRERTPPLDEAAARRTREFPGPVARRLTAEQFVDAVWQLTGAAPLRADANVVRAKSGAGAGRPATPESTARWIWNRAEASAGAPAGQTIVFRRRFELPAQPTAAIAAITCDNQYTLIINSAVVHQDDNWETVESLPVANRLKAGDNELLVVAANGGATPNPAGLICELRIDCGDQPRTTIASDASWHWTSTRPDGNGRFRAEPQDWKPAAMVANPQVWAGRVHADFVAALNPSHGSRMVRAALMKNDFLMRSLGRPHREQIVTMRPAEFTTLEAIDLANSQLLAEYLRQGGQQWQSRYAASPTALINQLYLQALCRSPAAEEVQVALELLGSPPTAAGAADLLWCVVMLPEFQFVR